MLVLSRRLNEKLLIPCIRTAIQVLSIQGGQVRLGIAAPAEVTVFREEIYKCDSPSGNSPPEDGPALPWARASGLLRNRLALLALSLDRLQRRMPETLAPAARDALDQLGGAFNELARIVNGLSDEDAPPTRRPVDCAR